LYKYLKSCTCPKAKERAKARVKKWSTLAEMPFQKIHRDRAKDGRVPTLRKL